MAEMKTIDLVSEENFDAKVGTADLTTEAQDLSGAVNELKNDLTPVALTDISNTKAGIVSAFVQAASLMGNAGFKVFSLTISGVANTIMYMSKKSSGIYIANIMSYGFMYSAQVKDGTAVVYQFIGTAL